MTTLHSGGASGVALKLKLPQIWLYTDSFWLILDGLSMLSVITAWVINLSHWFAGNFESAPNRVEMKWFLKVCTALSVGFVQ